MSAQTNPQDDTTREREVIVTNNGNGHSGLNALVAIVALVLLVVVGIFAFNAFSGGDEGGSIIPDELNVDIDGGGSGGGEG